MKIESTPVQLACPSSPARDLLTTILRDGAQRLLTRAIEAEVAEFIDARSHLVGADGHREVVRNGHLPPRTIVTGIGPIDVKQPRVRDRRPPGEAERFSSRILPPYLRETKSIDELIPWLYLKGISSSDFPEALAALAGKQYAYVWADGVHFNIRLQEDRQCILVLMGATPEGRKELVAIADGHRESEESWKALPKVFPTTRSQRCWVHKLANVLDKMLRRVQPEAKRMLHGIFMAHTREDANRAHRIPDGPVWRLARATVQRRRAQADGTPRTPVKRGPKSFLPDDAILSEIRTVLAFSFFVGEGHREAWARLRQERGVCTSMRRVLTLAQYSP